MEELAELFGKQFEKLQNELLEAGLNEEQALKIAIGTMYIGTEKGIEKGIEKNVKKIEKRIKRRK